MKNRTTLGISAAVLALSALGCSNTAEGVKQDSKENAAAAERKADETKAATADERAAAKEAGAEAKDDLARAGDALGDSARTAGEKISEAAKETGEKVSAGAREVTPALDAKKQTLDVKAALLADQTVDASKIDVDTDQATKTVHLKGSVPTAAQKAEAEKIAKAKAEGYSVHNMLVVARR